MPELDVPLEKKNNAFIGGFKAFEFLQVILLYFVRNHFFAITNSMFVFYSKYTI